MENFEAFHCVPKYGMVYSFLSLYFCYTFFSQYCIVKRLTSMLWPDFSVLGR